MTPIWGKKTGHTKKMAIEDKQIESAGAPIMMVEKEFPLLLNNSDMLKTTLMNRGELLIN